MTRIVRALIGFGVVGGAGILSLRNMAEGQQPARPQPRPPALIGVRPQVVPAGPRPALPVVGGVVPGDLTTVNAVDSITFPTDRKAKRSLSAAEDFIKEEAWGEAARILQSLLDSKEDVLVEVQRDGASRWRSLWGEADRLIGSMPPKGREFYELQYGARAKARLAEARAKNDAQILADVAQRYRHTDAGAEATEALATYELDRGRYMRASQRFERLLEDPQAKPPAPLTLFKAALAAQRAGERDNFERAWRRLEETSGAGVRLGDQLVKLDDLRQVLDRYTSEVEVAGAFDWPMFKGNPGRDAEGNGGAPFLEATWTRPMWRQVQTEHWIKQAISTLEERQQPVMSGYFPLAVTAQTKKGPVPLLVYRSYYGVHAVDLRDGKLFWESPTVGGFDKIVEYPEKQAQLNTWLVYYMQSPPPGAPHLLLENSTVGTLSSDGSRVYLVDDLVLPPHPSSPSMQQLTWGGPASFGPLDDLVKHSTLQAFDLATGKFLWELGGSEGGDFGETYFLGPPLPLAGNLYVLIEKASELRLVCLGAQKGEVIWSQPLANVRDRLLLDVGRRIRGVNLAYGDGIIICPTHAGAVLGVDLLSHSLVWEYSYREESPPAENGPAWPRRMPGVWMSHANQSLAGDWKASAPVVADGKVVFTAPDGGSVYCLNLRDGSLLWKESRGDDLYLAGVYDGKVVLVGRGSCRALGLADGKPLWKVDTGLPSGEGVASGKMYYLPLQSTLQSKDPEVCRIDLETGQITAHTKSRKHEVAGNLLFYGGDVYSQTPTAVSAYPQLPVRLAEINEALKRDPNDPVGLTDRGELKLDQGDLAGAVQDLRTALGHHPPPAILPRARAKYFETLTELFQRDFNATEPYLEEYRELCKVPIPADASAEDRQKLEEEQQRRQANFLCLLGKGRERQGKLVEAFQAYLDFGALAANRELVSVIDEPAVKARPDVWAQGRIAAMLAQATPEQRQPLEERINRQWEAARGSKDLETVRRFASLFGTSFPVGAEARLELADRLANEGSFLEAELILLQVRQQNDPKLAAKATAALARLMAKKDLPADAAYWYRVLARDFSHVALHEGLTGADLLREAAADPRIHPFLDDRPRGWQGHFQVKVINNGFSAAPTITLEPEGEMLPYFERYRFALQGGSQLKLIDQETNEERWSQQLSSPGAINPYLQMTMANHVPLRLQGHLAVVTLGTMIYALDPVAQKVLWQHSLHGPGMGNHAMMADPNGIQIYVADGGRNGGQVGPVEASYVCVHSREGLTALDPIRGTVLWTKTDVPSAANVFGDERHLFWVESRPDGTVGSGHALRADDGVSVNVPEFGPLFRQRIAVIGGRLLAPARRSHAWVLYDVLSGKEVWRETFTPGAIKLRGEEFALVGIAEREDGGRLRVFNLRTQRPVLETHVDPRDLDKVQEGQLLQDRDSLYVVLQKPFDPLLGPGVGSQPMSNVAGGLHSIPVNGKVYAFERDTGKLRWRNEVANQFLITDQFGEMPILIFTARYIRFRGAAVNNQQAVVTQSIDKRTGKRLFSKEQTGFIPQFYTLTVNRRIGTVELSSQTHKIQHYLVADGSSGTETKP